MPRSSSLTRVISRAEIERRVIDGLRRRLVKPRFLEVFVTEYQAGLNRAATKATANAEQQRELPRSSARSAACTRPSRMGWRSIRSPKTCSN